VKRSIAIALAALSISAADCARAQPQTAWVLMSREGECAKIAEAQRRRFSELPPIASSSLPTSGVVVGSASR